CVVSGFSRTSRGPPEGGHDIRTKKRQGASIARTRLRRARSRANGGAYADSADCARCGGGNNSNHSVQLSTEAIRGGGGDGGCRRRHDHGREVRTRSTARDQGTGTRPRIHDIRAVCRASARSSERNGAPSLGASGARRWHLRRTPSPTRVRVPRGRSLHQRRAPARRARARHCPRGAGAARRTEARRSGSQEFSPRDVGQRAAHSAPGVYSRSNAALNIPVEYASHRKIRERNKLYYRFNHWPIWIFVFFIAPGPLTFDLFERGFDARMALWLGAVLAGTGIAGLRGALPGVEPRPYIIRFTEDRPNPLYRRVCYTFAWSEVITFAVLNITGLVVAIVTGEWYLKQIYRYAYFPLAGSIWLLGALGQLPRVKPSTKGEGHERRYFYGSVWAVCWAQPTLWLLWKILPQTRLFDAVKLVVFVGII